MTDYGVTVDGFVIKPQTEIEADMVADAKGRSELGPDLDYSSTSPLGQIFGVAGAALAEVWELSAAVYASGDPEAAVGVPLDNVASLTGTLRPEARASVAVCTLNLDDGVSVPAGSIVSPAGREQILFTLDEAVENTSGVTADFPGTFTCTVTGAINVDAGQLTVIGSPITGWNSVTNAEDAVPGRDVASNQELRALRAQELARRGGSTVSAIRADVLQVEGVDSVIVLENKRGMVDVNGLPGHSFEVILDDGEIPAADDDDVAQAILDSAPAGIEDGGTSSGEATDSEGLTHELHFSRVERKNVYVSLTLTVNDLFPTNGPELVADAIVAAGNTYRPGDTAVALYLRSQAFSVSGVVDVPVFTLGYTASPVGTANLPVSFRQRNTFDTGRVVVTVP